MRVDYKLIIRNIFLNVMGALVYAIAVRAFLISNDLGEGGVTGLMTIFYYCFKIPTWLTNCVLNTIILILGWKLLDKKTVYYTLLTIFSISAWLHVVDRIHFELHDPLVAALAGGTLMGIAMGLIFKGHGTIAGSTVLAAILNKYFGFKTGYAMLIFDYAVAIPSLVVIGFENMLLTLVELYASAVVLNKILAWGVDQKALLITGEFPQTLGTDLTQLYGGKITELAGDTGVQLYYVCATSKYVNALNKIKQLAPAAYVVVSDVRSSYGRDVLRLL
ncbi:YitT family protein [Ligilactobacillus saerimneri]|uniref:YitT family protein n=1 Tax=Ligilactobacillus saerimneri TaxID=228229 RepID=UPI00048685DD|nr:YitT family protein [Ligilactobacillus saerimneri]